MFTMILAFSAGLLIGWNLLPQPGWVKRAWDFVASKIRR